MSEKVTIKDIARVAGVSVATVSYVINNRPDQSISEEVRQKIWQVVNMLNYKPSAFAKNLRTAPQSKLIALCTESDSSLLKADLVSIMEIISNKLSDTYSLLYITKPFSRIDNADAIIAYNVSKEYFYKIGNANFIPLIAVDCVVDDQLFFQVTTDFERLKSLADKHFDGTNYTFVCLTPTDVQIAEQIKGIFTNVHFVKTLADLEKIDSNKIFVANSTIMEILQDSNKDIFYTDYLYPQKCEQVISCIQQALSHKACEIHAYKV